MIEFEDANVCFAAINTRMHRKIDAHLLVDFGLLLSILTGAPVAPMLKSLDAVTVGTANPALSDFSFDSGPAKALSK